MSRNNHTLSYSYSPDIVARAEEHEVVLPHLMIDASLPTNLASHGRALRLNELNILEGARHIGNKSNLQMEISVTHPQEELQSTPSWLKYSSKRKSLLKLPHELMAKDDAHDLNRLFWCGVLVTGAFLNGAYKREREKYSHNIAPSEITGMAVTGTAAILDYYDYSFTHAGNLPEKTGWLAAGLITVIGVGGGVEALKHVRHSRLTQAANDVTRQVSPVANSLAANHPVLAISETA